MNETALAQGPLQPTQRIELPHLDAYVEIRNENWPTKIGYDIEFGSLRYGFRGAWGRDGSQEAWECFTDALAYIVNHWSK